MRQVGGYVPFSFVVSPEGLIKKCQYHANLGTVVRARVLRDGTGATRVGNPYIDPEYQRKGWVFLEDLYKQDSRPEVREQGYQLWLDYNKMVQQKVNGAYVLKHRREGDSKERRLFAQKFPEDLLPEEVMRRRSGDSNVSGGKFIEPSLKKTSKRGKATQQASS